MPFPTSLDGLADNVDIVRATHVNSLQNILVGPVWANVKNVAYGAKGDGATDDTNAVQVAINAVNAAGGGVVFLPAGTYRFATSLTMKANVTLRGAGLDATILLFDDVAGACITTTNGPTSTRTVSGAQALGSFTVVLTAGGGALFSAGAWAYITDANGTFLTKVLSVATDTLTLREALPFNFLSSATVGYWTGGGLLSGVVIEDLTAKVAVIPSVTRPYVFSLQYCERPIIRRCKGMGSLNYIFQYFGCRDGLVIDSTADTVQSGTTGDGFNFQAGTGDIVQNVRAINCAFGTSWSREAYPGCYGSTFGGRTATGSARGVEMVSCAYGTIVGNHISDYLATGIKCQDSYGCALSNNTIENLGGTGAAISVDGNTASLCHHNSVTGNAIKNCGGYGIVFNPTGGSANAMYNVASGNSISGTGNIGIFAACGNNTISGNSMDAYTTAGVWLDTGTTQNTVTGNSFKNAGVGNAITSLGSSGGNYIIANALNGEAVNLNALDVRFFQNALAGDTTMTLANTWYAGPAVTVPAGVWLLTVSMTVRVVNLGMFEGRIFDGTSSLASVEMYGSSNGASVVLPMTLVVAPTASTTYTAQAASTTTVNLIKAATFNNGVGNNASTITAARIA